jgi:hypothetical protein
MLRELGLEAPWLSFLVTRMRMVCPPTIKGQIGVQWMLGWAGGDQQTNKQVLLPVGG